MYVNLCMYVCMYEQAERRVVSEREAAEKRVAALQEDAEVIKPEWVGGLVFSRAKYFSQGMFCVIMDVCLYVCMKQYFKFMMIFDVCTVCMYV